MELFRPHLAIAFGHASSFGDNRASSFSLMNLFAPPLDTALSSSLLNKLTLQLPDFDRFSDLDPMTGRAMDPSSFEIFDVKDYLPELQFALGSSPSIEFAPPTFKASDIFEAFVPDSTLTLKAMGKFVKKKIISKITNVLDGLFSVEVDIPTGGLTNDLPTLGASISLGSYSESSTQLFPPTLDVESVEDFDFDFDVEIVDGKLVLEVGFAMKVVNVNPLNALSDVAGSLSSTLMDQSGEFQDVANTLGNSIDSASEMFQSLAESDNIQLLLNASLDLSVNIGLSPSEFEFSSSLSEFKSSLFASIEDELSFGIFTVNPRIQLYLEADNTAVAAAKEAGTTVDIFKDSSSLAAFAFGGIFDSRITVAIDNVPASLTLRAYSSDITNVDALEFEFLWDIDLMPIQDGEYFSWFELVANRPVSLNNVHVTFSLFRNN